MSTKYELDMENLKQTLIENLVEYIDGLLEDEEVNDTIKNLVSDAFEDIIKL